MNNLKIKATVATIFVAFKDGTASQCEKWMFTGTPTKGDVKTIFSAEFKEGTVKKIVVNELERVVLEVPVTRDDYKNRTLEEIINNFVTNDDSYEVGNIFFS